VGIDILRRPYRQIACRCSSAAGANERRIERAPLLNANQRSIEPRGDERGEEEGRTRDRVHSSRRSMSLFLSLNDVTRDRDAALDAHRLHVHAPTWTRTMKGGTKILAICVATAATLRRMHVGGGERGDKRIYIYIYIYIYICRRGVRVVAPPCSVNLLSLYLRDRCTLRAGLFIRLPAISPPLPSPLIISSPRPGVFFSFVAIRGENTRCDRPAETGFTFLNAA